MRNIIITIILLCIYLVNLQAVEKLNFQKGKPVTIDGCFSKSEWNDATKVNLLLIGNDTVNIYFKHDGENLLFAFCKNLRIEQYQFRFPEIMLDINNTKTTTWDGDDHWFHVSGTDCNSKGHPNDYANCLEVQPDWLGEKNFMDPKFNDTVEISIPFSKVGIDPEQNKFFGIAFDVTDTQTFWIFYPSTAKMNNPSTWADAEIIMATNVIDNPEGSISILPNPAGDFITVTLSDINPTLKRGVDENSIHIFNSLGEMVMSESIHPKTASHRMNIENLPQGLYFIKIGNYTEKFEVLR